MADFSDEQDKRLFDAVKTFVDAGKPVCWSKVEKKLRWKTFPVKKLQSRMAQLKTRYGKDLSAFPKRFFVVRKKCRHTDVRRAPKAQMVTFQPLRRMNEIFDAPSRLPTYAFPLSKNVAIDAVIEIFQSVTKSDVWQCSGRTELNVGEVLPVSVSSMVWRCMLSKDDVFVDIGSGVGNVVAQVALESLAKSVLGLEVREDVSTLGTRLINASTSNYRQLRKARIIQGDVQSATAYASLASATVLYCHNTVFSDGANLALEQLVCTLTNLRMCIIALPFCGRHRASCQRDVCQRWIASGDVDMSVSYTNRRIPFSVYTRAI